MACPPAAPPTYLNAFQDGVGHLGLGIDAVERQRHLCVLALDDAVVVRMPAP
jgi:hypothetical protein